MFNSKLFVLLQDTMVVGGACPFTFKKLENESTKNTVAIIVNFFIGALAL
jgi:hypothetical protein